MKPDGMKPRARLALGLLLGALVLTLMGIAAWRIIRWVVVTKASEQATAVVSSAWKIARGSAFAVSGVSIKDMWLPCSGDYIGKNSKPLPNARLYYSSIEPTEYIAEGQVLHAMAIFYCPPGTGWPVLKILNPYGQDHYARLYDDGTHGDRAADDGLWESDLAWDSKWSSDSSTWVQVVLGLSSKYDNIYGAHVILQERAPGPAGTKGSEGVPKALQ